jgi:predicted phage terminase large subunit-like protein
VIEIRPQRGPQEQFLSSPADIVIYGGAAGGGKSYGLLIEPLRHITKPGFGATIFRRTGAQIRNQGGLWDESEGLYPLFGGAPRESMLDWGFPSRTGIKFAHLEHEKSKFDYHGAQIPLIGWDELTQFSESTFFYMLSRNRSLCGVRPYMRATCNPDPDSFVARLIAWWIDQQTGYAIQERSGVIRWLQRVGDDIIWAARPEDLPVQRAPDGTEVPPKSLTFIPAKLSDNKKLLAKDPSYYASLMALPLVERERLLGGNWKIRAAAGLYFRRGYFEIVDAAPADALRIRRWDLAGTDESEGADDPDWTVGLKMSRTPTGMIYIEHVERFQGSPNRVQESITNLAAADGKRCWVGLPQDPGQAGKSQVQYLAAALAGYRTKIERETGDKVTRASALSSQAEAGNVKLVRGPWNEAFLNELENFPGGRHDDQVDAASGAFNMLIEKRNQLAFGTV